MKHIPSRDITGRCEGECRNIVHEADVRRQSEISSFDSVFHEKSRNAHMPSRDITGRCEGECRNLVHEADVRRQSEMSSKLF